MKFLRSMRKLLETEIKKLDSLATERLNNSRVILIFTTHQ